MDQQPPHQTNQHQPNPSPSDALPHPPHLTHQSPLSIYLSASFKPFKPPHPTPTTAAAAAYAVYINSQHPPLHHHIAEPLAHRHQSLDAALLTAVTAALKLVYPYSPHAVTIHSDHPHLSHIIFSNHPKEVQQSKHHHLFQQTWHLVDQFNRSGILLSIVVDSADRVPSLQQARRLADAAVENHAFCRLCRRNYGRAGSAHQCRPVCFLAPCSGLRLDCVDDYERHVEQRHPVNVVYADGGRFGVRRSQHDHTSSDEGSTDGESGSVVYCPQCGAGYRDLGALAKHVEANCTDALDRWLQQTRIVKQ